MTWRRGKRLPLCGRFSRHGRALRLAAPPQSVDALVLDGPGHLQIPRKELQRAFVLRPIADIAPAFRHPVSGLSMAELWAAFPAGSEPLQVESLRD